MPDAAQPLSVVLLTLPESTPGTLYGLHEVLGVVGTAWSQATGEPECARRRFRSGARSAHPLPGGTGAPHRHGRRRVVLD